MELHLPSDRNKSHHLRTASALHLTRPPPRRSWPECVASREGTSYMRLAADENTEVDWSKHEACMKKASNELRVEKETEEKVLLEEVLPNLPQQQSRCIRRAVDHKTSSWLTAKPLTYENWDLCASEFRDGLALRYGLPLVEVPATCECGKPFDMNHGLNCHYGGLIDRRHNEIRDTLAELSIQAFGGLVIKEPVIDEGDEVTPGKRLDIVIRGALHPQTSSFIDVVCVNTDAMSYKNRDTNTILESAEAYKRTKYAERCKELRGQLIPFATSVDGALGKDAKDFMRKAAQRMAANSNKTYSEVCAYLKTKISVSTIRATTYCLRGPRQFVRSGVDDASIDATVSPG
eukprot:Selendium_serpulae@DN6443_c1_g1_i14.p1